MKNSIVTTIILTLFAFNIQSGEIPFAAPQTIGAMDDVKDVFPADLDGDGDLDAVGGGWTDSSRTMWWQNLTIQRSALYPTDFAIAPALTQPFSITTADLDGDGDLDPLTSANLSSQVSWWVNDGSAAVGVWTEMVIDTGPSGAKRAAAGDVDGDGGLDALCAVTSANQVLWWPNLGGQFALPTADAVTDSRTNEGTEAVALQIQLDHRGRSGDDDVELATLELLFESAAGVSLSAAELEALSDALHLYLDDGDGVWDVQDAVIASVLPPYALTTGVMSVVLPDDSLDLQTAVGSSKTYFVTLDLAAAAGSASVP